MKKAKKYIRIILIIIILIIIDQYLKVIMPMGEHEIITRFTKNYLYKKYWCGF